MSCKLMPFSFRMLFGFLVTRASKIVAFTGHPSIHSVHLASLQFIRPTFLAVESQPQYRYICTIWTHSEALEPEQFAAFNGERRFGTWAAHVANAQETGCTWPPSGGRW